MATWPDYADEEMKVTVERDKVPADSQGAVARSATSEALATSNEKGLSRRRLMALTATAVGWSAVRPAQWVFALSEHGAIAARTAEPGETFSPVFFTAPELEAVARLAETIIPRTESPGARDARVHEYLDLALSVEPEAAARGFRAGLGWVDKRCRKVFGKSADRCEVAELSRLLAEVSDEKGADPAKFRRSLRTGAEFFEGLKRRVVFGYYTSWEGRVKHLGLPDAVTTQVFRGCGHPSGEHV